jgi:DNA-binding response OmpR family regulator
MQRILIVDDNTTLAYFTARNLERDIQGIAVSTAASCADARRQIDEDFFSVMIADLNLSDGNGLDLVKEVRARFPEMSAILISGEEPPQELRSGLHGFLLKPYEAPSLSELVRGALAKETRSLPQSTVTSAVEKCRGYNHHFVRNQLSALLAGLRAFEADLRHGASSPETVNKTIDDYLDRLCGYVHEVTKELPVCGPKGKNGAEEDLNQIVGGGI